MARSRPRATPTAEPGFGRRTARILGRTFKAFFADNVPRLGAALAFYITVAVAPLLVLTLAVAGVIFDDPDARRTVVSEMENLIGSDGAEVVASIDPPEQEAGGIGTTVAGFVTLLYGSLGVFRHLQDVLNAIWRVKREPDKNFWSMLVHRLFSIATVLMIGFLLLVSLILSAALTWFGGQTLSRFDVPAYLLESLNFFLSFIMITVLFALIFKLLPNADIKWRHVWVGAIVTAALFTLGKFLLGLYLGRASVTSAYGAAGSIIALLLWCSYASQIVFFGAEFTRITSRSNGGRDFSTLERDGVCAL